HELHDVAPLEALGVRRGGERQGEQGEEPPELRGHLRHLMGSRGPAARVPLARAGAGTHSRATATAIGTRAARPAGSRPASSPVAAATATAKATRRGVTAATESIM